MAVQMESADLIICYFQDFLFQNLRFGRNDLTDAAIEVSPDIRRALQAIESTPNCHIARLSGSGATCFGIYDNPAAAAAAVNKIRQEYPTWWVKASGLFRE